MLLSNAFRPDVRVLKEANSLAGYGYKVTIICWDRLAEMEIGEETLNSGVKIKRVQSVSSQYGVGAGQIKPLFLFWVEAWKILNQLCPDLVHCHDFDTLPLGLAWGKTHKKPVVYDAHEYYADLVLPRLRGTSGKILYKLIKFLEALGAHSADAVVTVDETLGEIYRKRNKKVLVIGHYPPRDLAGTYNPLFQGSELQMLYSGRISRDRGAFYYVDLLRMLIEKGIPVKLVLAGVFTPESEAARFWEYAQGVQTNIEYLGWVSYRDMPGVLHKVDIGLAVLMPEPRYVAAIPVKLFDYMSGGLPIIASHFEPIRQIVEREQCGITVDPQQPPLIAANQIIEWYKNPQAARTTGEKGRQAILREYNWENLIAQLAQTYDLLLN